ncbi:MAG: hypothetical protein R2715_03360 [Ilumatobacteraceae bacterium]
MSLGDERYCLTVPLGDDATPVGYLIGELDLAPIQALFGQQETLGRTAEAHLVQQTEAGAEFITDLRFKEGVRFALEIPRAQVTMPAILAAYGAGGDVRRPTRLSPAGRDRSRAARDELALGAGGGRSIAARRTPR